MSRDRAATLLEAFVSRGEIAREMRSDVRRTIDDLLTDKSFEDAIHANVVVASLGIVERIVSDKRVPDVSGVALEVARSAYATGLTIGLAVAELAADRW